SCGSRGVVELPFRDANARSTSPSLSPALELSRETMMLELSVWPAARPVKEPVALASPEKELTLPSRLSAGVSAMLLTDSAAEAWVPTRKLPRFTLSIWEASAWLSGGGAVTSPLTVRTVSLSDSEKLSSL